MHSLPPHLAWLRAGTLLAWSHKGHGVTHLQPPRRRCYPSWVPRFTLAGKHHVGALCDWSLLTDLPGGVGPLRTSRDRRTPVTTESPREMLCLPLSVSVCFRSLGIVTSGPRRGGGEGSPPGVPVLTSMPSGCRERAQVHAPER